MSSSSSSASSVTESPPPVPRKNAPLFLFTDNNISEAVSVYFSGKPHNYPPISEWNVSQVTDMSQLFYSQREMSSVDLSKWDVSNVRTMHSMFNQCHRFSSDLSGWDVSKVTDMSYMFYECFSFNADLSLWKVKNVQNMDSMFSRCGQFFSYLAYWRLNPAITQRKIQEMELDTTKVPKEFYPKVYTPRAPLPLWEVPNPNPHFVLDAAIPSLELPNTEELLGEQEEEEPDTPAAAENAKVKRKMDGEDEEDEEDETEEEITPPRKTAPPLEEKEEEESTPPPAMTPPPVPPVKTPIRTNNEFIKRFKDYPAFMEFIHSDLSVSSPREYHAYYSKIKPSFFIRFAPEGYSFNDVSIDFGDEPHPFYVALRLLLAKLNQFNLSTTRIGERCTEYSYGVHLNRLLYYYTIYVKMVLQRQLESGNDSAGLIIPCHGEFLGISPRDLPSSGNLKNIFICNKSVFGCGTYSSINLELESTLGNHMGGQMRQAINQFHYVPFDEIIPPSSDNKGPFSYPSCRKTNNSPDFPGAMNYQISINSHKYLDKEFSYSYQDDPISRMILDVRALHYVKQEYNIDEERLQKIAETLRIQDSFNYHETKTYVKIIDQANILNQPELSRRILGPPDKSMTLVTLHDIVDFYSHVIKKTNLFIFDLSCGANTYLEKQIGDYKKMIDVRRPIGTRIPRDPKDSLEEHRARESAYFEIVKENILALNAHKQSLGFGRKKQRRGNNNNNTRRKKTTKTRHHRSRYRRHLPPVLRRTRKRKTSTLR